MGLLTRYKAFNRWQKIVLWTGLFLVFYTLFGFFILPRILQKISVDKLTNILERQVSISKITFNPYSLFLTIEELYIKEKNSDKTFFSFDKVMVNLQTSSIFRLGPVIREVRIDGLFFNATRYKDQTYNFSDLIPSKSTNLTKIKEKEHPKPFKPLNFSVSNIIFNNGKIIINDLPQNKTHFFSEMEIAIPFISNLDTHMDIFVTPHFSVNFNGSPITLEGETKPFLASQTTKMNLDLKGIDLKTYYDYIPFKTNMDLNSGTMDLFCSIEFSQLKDKEILPQLFLSGELRLFRLGINDLKANSVFKMDELSISIDQSEIMKGDINIKEVIVSSPNISLALGKLKGDSNPLNIYNLIPESNIDTKNPSKESTIAGTPKKPLPVKLNCGKIAINNALVTLKDVSDKKDVFSLQNFAVENIKLETEKQLVNIGKISALNGSLNVYRLIDNQLNIEALLPPQNSKTKPEPKPASDKEITPAWNVNVAKIEFNEFTIKADDLISKDKGQILLDNITLNSKGFSTVPETKTESSLSFNLNKDGKINISGNMGINPLAADVALSVDQIHLAKFQPFVAEYLNLIISDGKFSTSSQVSMVKSDKGPLKAKYQGAIDINDFHVVDSQKTKTLIKFRNLGIKDIDFNVSPMAASIKTLKIMEPIINVAIYSNGSLNFNEITKDTAQKEDTNEGNNQEDSSSIPIKIGQVIMEKGQVVFNDQSVTPNFKTILTQINANITGLSSEETIESNIKIKAMVNKHTPVEIKGKINPLKTDFFCDMIVACSDMDLGYLSPYAGKYAGYKIQKGKLSLDLKYLVDKRKINSTNDIFLDQFDFGEKVESEDAIKAPMRLAVSLLKDPMGRISLDIPVKGDLDDPKFSLGGIIIKVIVNLLVKAATAPFSLLGAMFGGGEDLNIIAFDAGSFDITSNGAQKVETLIKALTQRPGLNLEIAGYVSIDNDKSALVEKKLGQRLTEEKLRIMIEQGGQAIPIDEITLSDEEYDMYLNIVFNQTEEGIQLTNQINSKEAANKDDENETIDSNTTEDIEEVDTAIIRDQMINIIKKSIQVSDDELKQLASDRALIIKGAMLAKESIDPKRIFIVEAETLEPEPSGEDDKSKKIKSGSVIMTLK